MRDLKNAVVVWLATGFGLGRVSPAPGTVGGLWGLPLAWAIGCLPTTVAQVLVLAVLGCGGVALCARAARVLGGGADPQAIVWDEIAALPIAYLGFGEKNMAIWVVGWLGFRVFDITKPWPIRHVERLPGGWGIMADDWVAAVLACGTLHGLVWLDSVWQLGWLSGAL